MRIIVILCVWWFIESSAQRCRTPGEWCSDTNQCCGGCCIRNICLRTYSDCSKENDLCFKHYCPGGSICQIYQPPCAGCDIIRQCVFISTEISNSTPATFTNLNLTSSSTDLISMYWTFNFYYVLQFLMTFFKCL